MSETLRERAERIVWAGEGKGEDVVDAIIALCREDFAQACWKIPWPGPNGRPCAEAFAELIRKHEVGS